MKRRLNILCLLVILVMSYSIFESTYYLGSAFMSGFRASFKEEMHRNPKRLDEISGMKPIELFPDDFANLKDSVYNAKSGKFVPALYNKLAVSVEMEPDIWLRLATLLSAFLDVFTSILAVILFVKLIISINKSQIFDWQNVRRLRWLGGVLILSFICSTIPICSAYYELSGVFEVPGYSLTIYGTISFLTLILGLMSLIVGEIFAIGLKMKEEQELTI